jgi:Na+-transporting NADH:ubiquinone oxidoreductase subunit A
MSGTVNLTAVENHITLENLSSTPDGESAGNGDDLDGVDDKRQVLLKLGVWSSLVKVDTGKTPDPETVPELLIVETARMEPFFPNPEVFLPGQMKRFADGLKLLRSSLEDAEIHVVVPDVASELNDELQQLAGESQDKFRLYQVSEIYPMENPELASQSLGFRAEKTWAIDAQGVLAAEQALNHGRAPSSRIVSVGGPASGNKTHFRVPPGYPLSQLVGMEARDDETRILDGGVITGREIADSQIGLDVECIALTVLQENNEREVLAFARSGYDRHGYTNAFLSFFRPLFREKYTTALRGEKRPCIFCGACEKVCPAGLLPHLIYNYLVNDRAEDASRVGLGRCVTCGLCSYVCVSKIEHLELFREAKELDAGELVGD